MKRLFLFNILSLLSLCLCLGQNQIIVTPAGEMPRAVSGHFAGIVDGQLTTWGGCNFPDVPCADGGQKVFYPKAYGASVTVPEGTVYIGGQGPLPESPLPALPSVACAPQSLCSQQAIAPLGECFLLPSPPSVGSHGQIAELHATVGIQSFLIVEHDA